MNRVKNKVGEYDHTQNCLINKLYDYVGDTHTAKIKNINSFVNSLYKDFSLIMVYSKFSTSFPRVSLISFGFSLIVFKGVILLPPVGVPNLD